MADTFEQIWRELRLYNPAAPVPLCQSWVRDSFRRILRRRLWSWALSEGQFTLAAPYSTGTLTLTNGSANVVGSGTVFTSSHVGRQLQVDQLVFTISVVTDGTNLTLDRTWPLSSVSGQSYTIKQVYLTAPSDFKAFLTVVDPEEEWQLHLHVPAEALDKIDPGRSSTGTPTLLADLKFSASGYPMWEIWPHPTDLKVLRYLYWKISPDLSDTQALPYSVDGRIIKLGALMEMCNWPGTKDEPNPMFSRSLAQDFMQQFEYELALLDRDDSEIYQTDLWYDEAGGLPYAPMDASFIQRHAMSYA